MDLIGPGKANPAYHKCFLRHIQDLIPRKIGTIISDIDGNPIAISFLHCIRISVILPVAFNPCLTAFSTTG